MGKSAVDFDDIQAVENRRREVAVLAGASPRATKFEPSPLKDMIVEYIEENQPEVSEKFADYQRETGFPGYNFTVTDQYGTGENNKELKSLRSQNQERDIVEERNAAVTLEEEARQNEYNITDTSTGLPKTPPPPNPEQQKADDEARKRQKEQREKENEQLKDKGIKVPTQSPAGSGDPRSAVQAGEKKSDSK